MKKIISWIGNLCVFVLLIFSVIMLSQSVGEWTTIDYIWLIAILLFIVGFIGQIFSGRSSD